MAVSLMRNGLTAENSIFSQKPDVKYSRSRFDLGRLLTFTSDIGMIVPVDLIPTYPRDEFDLGCQYQIDFRPMVVTSLTSYKVKVHYFFCPNEYLWTNWESFITKGRSGDLVLTVPSIRLDLLSKKDSNFPTLGGLTDDNFKTTSGEYYPLGAMSLPSLLIGSIPYDTDLSVEDSIPDHYLPFLYDTNTLKETGYRMLRTNALPFLMYQKIFRSNYLDPNLMANNTVESPVWFPDDIDSSHWRFNGAATNLFGTYLNYFVPDTISSPPAENSIIANFVPIPNLKEGEDDLGDNAVNLLQLRYAMYNDDMFTTALPFLQRGPVTSLDADVVGAIISGKAYLDSDGVVLWQTSDGAMPNGSFYSTPPNASRASLDSILRLYNSDSSVFASGFVSGDNGSPATGGADVVRPYVNGADLSIDGLQVSFTAQKLRELIALSVWQERNSLTNGSYSQFVQVHFGGRPRNQFCEPIYIGGTTSHFNISSVLQTSASQTGSTPLGNPAGIGSSSNGRDLGHFIADDFGFIMGLMMIIPDSIYNTSHDHWEFDLHPDDYFMPEYENLSFQPILKKQLFAVGDEDQGNNSVDNSLFGYSNRYVYLKNRDSITRGRFGLPSSIDTYYHSYVQSREFKDSPVLSQSFVTVYPPNIDRSFLSYPGEPCFLVQYYSNTRAVRNMSYVSQPNNFGF